jgi:hypothetical protein
MQWEMYHTPHRMDAKLQGLVIHEKLTYTRIFIMDTELDILVQPEQAVWNDISHNENNIQDPAFSEGIKFSVLHIYKCLRLLEISPRELQTMTAS